jgi:hypothetical protein
VKRKKQKRDAEDRRNLKRRALRVIEDREWDEEIKHLDDDESEWPEEEEVPEDSGEDGPS